MTNQEIGAELKYLHLSLECRIAAVHKKRSWRDSEKVTTITALRHRQAALVQAFKIVTGCDMLKAHEMSIGQRDGVV